LLLLSLALAGPAWAGPGASPTQQVHFGDSYDVFQGLDFDTGVLPAGSPLGVRFVVASNGGWQTDVDAWSDLWWPDALSHELTGGPEDGSMRLATHLTLAAQVVVDLSAIGQGTVYVNVWNDAVDLSAETTFDGLLLADSASPQVAVSTDGDVIGPWQYTQTLFTGVDLVFSARAYPKAHATLTGEEIDTEDGTGTTWAYANEADVGQFDVPLDDPGQLALSSTLWAQLDAGFDLVVEPQVQVCAPVIGCLNLASFQIPIPLTSVSQERAMGPVDYAHPLPALDVDPSPHDFGEVLVGNTANFQVPLGNLGLLDVQGGASLQGDTDAFTVFPASFYAPVDGQDGVVVSFTPPSEGTWTAVLTLDSDDPARPSVTIPLQGTGYVPDTTPPPTVSVDNGCGCATGGPGGSAFGVLVLLAFAMRRRR